jgi:hypothetical protein
MKMKLPALMAGLAQIPSERLREVVNAIDRGEKLLYSGHIAIGLKC